MKKLFKIIIFVTGILLAATPSFSNDINWHDDANIESVMLFNNGSYTISIFEMDNVSILRFAGKIDASTVKYLSYFYMAIGPQYLALSGPGGELLSGLELGSFIKQLDIPVVVLPRDVCLSSCAYAAIASPKLEVEGILGFHMPGFTDFDPSIPTEKYVNLAMSISWSVTSWFRTNKDFTDAAINVIVRKTSSNVLAVVMNNEQLNRLADDEADEKELFKIMSKEEILVWATEWERD